MIPRKRQSATARAALLLTLVLSGCGGLALPKEDMPARGADPAYNDVAASYLKTAFKDRAFYDTFEISRARWVHSLKGWNWLTCVRFHDHGHQRTYALFINDGAVIDARYAVETDACDGETYAPFNAMNPTTAGIQAPLY